MRVVISQTLGHTPQWVACFDALADAVQAGKGWTGECIDLLLWQTAPNGKLFSGVPVFNFSFYLNSDR